MAELAKLMFLVVYEHQKLFPENIHIKAWAGLICKFPMAEYLADGNVILLHQLMNEFE